MNDLQQQLRAATRALQEAERASAGILRPRLNVASDIEEHRHRDDWHQGAPQFPDAGYIVPVNDERVGHPLYWQSIENGWIGRLFAVEEINGQSMFRLYGVNHLARYVEGRTAAESLDMDDLQWFTLADLYPVDECGRPIYWPRPELKVSPAE